MNNIKKNKLLNKVIVICFYGRSGSVFLHSLFDNHPNIVTFPGTFLMEYQKWWDSFIDKQSLNCGKKFLNQFNIFFTFNNSKIKIKGTYIKDYKNLNFHKTGKNRKEKIFINKTKFKKNLYELLNIEKETSYSFFKKIHLALAKTINIKINNKLKIVFHLHTPSEKRTRFLLDGEFKCKFIHIIRNPVISCTSLHVSNLNAGYNFGLEGILGNLNRFRPIYNDKFSRAIKLEDLHNKPKQTLRKLISFLKIKWSSKLLESTFLGKKWYNLRDTNHLSGFNKVIISKKYDLFLSPYDKSRLSYLYKNVYQKWKYNIEKKHYFFEYFLRFKCEKKDSIINYFRLRKIIFKIMLRNFLSRDKIIKLL